MERNNDSLIAYPRVLLISNNAFSKVTNNGKTLASFFKGFPSDKIAQLYFNNEVPSDMYYRNYFRITDQNMLKSRLHGQSCGSVIHELDPLVSKDASVSCITSSRFKKGEAARIIRELVWKSNKWKSPELHKWLDEFSPDIIFLCAGDSGFAYTITEYLKTRYRAKSVIYITDDYVLPRQTKNPFWWIRRNFILNKMKTAVQDSDLFLTISNEMRTAYKSLFGADSKLAINITTPMKIASEESSENTFFEFVYTGGLHFKRYETLRQLAVAIEAYNDGSNNRKARLNVYSSTEPSNEVKESINYKNTSYYRGSLDSESLKIVLNKSDILVHVESFDVHCIESTRLSISTKIPEYLSLGKPILAIGPTDVASMKYIQDSAYCITDSNHILEGVKKLMSDDILLFELSEKADEKYQRNHKIDTVLSSFTENIISII